MPTSWLSPRRAKAVCLLAIVAAPVLLYGAGKAFESNSNNIVDWLPQSFEETQRLYWFVERFGSDEILVISWDGCTLDDERLDEVAARLRSPVANEEAGDGGPDVGGQRGGGAGGREPDRITWFRNVYTGRQTLRELTEQPPHLTREQALQRMDGWLIGRDLKTTCVLAMVSEYGMSHRHAAIEFVREVTESAGIAREQTYIAGPTADSVAVDRASNNGMLELGLLSAAVGMFASWACLRDLRLLTMLFASAVFAWSMSLSCLYFLGPGMDAVLLVMPGLVFVLAVSGGLHLTNYYKDVLEEGPAADAPMRAIGRAWMPCILAVSTTALGLGSLIISQLTPIRRFGLYASIGVLLSLVALMLLWPSIATWWSPRSRRLSHSQRNRRSEWWQPLFATSARNPYRWLAIALVTMPMFVIGVSRLETSVKLQDLFRADSEIVRSSHWMRTHLGALIPVEIVLRFPREEDERMTGMFRRALIVERLREEVAGSPNFDSAVAATTFAPPLPREDEGPQLFRRRLLAGRLPEYRSRFVDFRLLRDEPHEELWRISARVNSADTEYGSLLRSLDQQLTKFLEAEASSGVAVTAEVSGAVPLIYLAQQRLLQDLITSYLVAFLLILVMMIVLMRGWAAGLLAMVPNVFPALVAFGLMGLTGTTIDIGTMMTASVAMGVAVDDTVHFLVWFRRGLTEGLSRHEAVRYAFSHCATAMLQTTVICGLGLLVFVLSPFVPVARFGLVMALMLLLALLGDLVLLPALLCSRLGHWFEPHTPSCPRNVVFSQPVGAIGHK